MDDHPPKNVDDCRSDRDQLSMLHPLQGNDKVVDRNLPVTIAHLPGRRENERLARKLSLQNFKKRLLLGSKSRAFAEINDDFYSAPSAPHGCPLSGNRDWKNQSPIFKNVLDSLPYYIIKVQSLHSSMLQLTLLSAKYEKM